MRGVCCERRDERPRKESCGRSKSGGSGQRRFYDFNFWSQRKRVEKLRYMHRNPVKCGLVLEPEQWAWSSYRGYAHDEVGIVKINQWPAAVMKIRTVA